MIILAIFLTVVLALQPAQSSGAPAPASTNTNYIDPATVKSIEPVCLQLTSDEFNGDGGFKKSEAAGRMAKETFDPSSGKRDQSHPNIFKMLLKGKEMSADNVQSYVSYLIGIAVTGILVAILDACSCVWCVCCRNCCRWACPNHCRLCKCIPKITHHTKEEQYLPVGVYSVFAVVLFAFGVAGVSNGVHKFNNSLVDGICLTDTTYLRFSQFLTNVQNPLDKLNTDFSLAVVSLTAAAQIDPALSQSVAEISPKFETLKNVANQAKLNVPPGSVYARQACDRLWSDIATMASEAKEQSVNSAEIVDESLQSVQTSIDNSLVQQSDTATTALTNAKTSIMDMQSQIDKAMDPRKYGLILLAHDIKGQKDNSGFAAFGWIFLVLLMVSVSIFGVHECKHHTTLLAPPKDNCHLPLQVIKLNPVGACFSRIAAVGWCCALFFGIFCGIFAALMLPLAAVMDDVCVVLPSLPKDLGTLAGGNVMVEDLVNTCWNKTGNLLDGLGLSDSIDVNSINFDAFDEQFGGTSVNIDTTELDKILIKLNNIDESNCGSVTPVKNAVADVKVQVRSAESAFANSDTVEKLKTEGKALISLVKQAVLGFMEATNCWFVKIIWEETVDVMCVGMKEAIQWWGSAELFIGLVCLPFAITVLFMMKRCTLFLLFIFLFLFLLPILHLISFDRYHFSDGGHGPIAAAGASQEMYIKDDNNATNNNIEMTVPAQDTMMVTVPAGYGAGSFVEVIHPVSGETVTVTIPEGMMEGMQFQVALPVATTSTYYAESESYAAVQDYNDPACTTEEGVEETNQSEYVVAVAETDPAVVVDPWMEGAEEAIDSTCTVNGAIIHNDASLAEGEI